MPTLKDSGFCGPSNPLPSVLQDSQRSINLYPEPGAPGSKSAMGMTGTPGLSLLGTLPTSPVRALWFDGSNFLYAVAGTHVYKVNPATGAVITDYGAIPGSGGFGLAQIVYDGNSAAGHLLVCDPSVTGGSVVRVDTMATVWTASFVEYFDGFIFAVTTGANQSVINQVNSSTLLDGTTWNALNFFQRTGSNDLVVGLAMINGLLWIFGQRNTEIWYDAGNPGFPLVRMSGAQLNIGCSDPATIQKLDGTVFWLGMDDYGWGKVYMAQGNTAQRISTPAIENLILQGLKPAGHSGLENPAVRAFAYTEAGHSFYVLNFDNGLMPGFGGGTSSGFAVVWDNTTKMWHERGSLSGPNLGSLLQVCAAVAEPNIAGSKYTVFVGDGNSGNIYLQGLPYTSENGATIKRVRVTPHVSNQNRYVSHVSLDMDADIGTASMILDYSNDGGRTFLGRNRTIPKQGTAAAAGMDHYKIWQLGHSLDRVYLLSVTDSANPIRFANAYLDVQQGTEE